MTNKKMAAGIAVLLVAACLIGAVAFTQFKSDKSAEKKPAKKVEEPEPEPPMNPLTGSLDYSEKAMQRRICGFVVENHPAARPQIGMDDPKYSPDIILEGEVEGGISRMFWMFADYTKLPETIGPLRSARPPYIRFARMFDSYFIHWGMSHTEGGYIGANSVFRYCDTDHINAMDFPDKSDAFGRDMTTGKSLEHTGRAYGKKIPAALKEAGFRKKPMEYTKLKFRDKNGTVGKKTCGEVTVTFSKISGNTHWTYDKEKNVYRTDSFQNNTERDNLIILSDKTEYVTKAQYQGHGVTYCDYLFAGGKAWVISNGTWTKLRWRKNKKDKTLVLYKVIKKKVPKTEEEKAAEAKNKDSKDESEESDYKIETKEVEYKLNKGKSWIGWISSNNGGKVDIKKIPEEDKDDEE